MTSGSGYTGQTGKTFLGAKFAKNKRNKFLVDGVIDENLNSEQSELRDVEIKNMEKAHYFENQNTQANKFGD